ncbi:MAG: hypothetical protein Q4F81_01410 [Eubacteriales bacterium]|nr:hypothetical protein [Eubacteriales bacterium]
MDTSKVYVLPNGDGYITRVDGGYTIGNITDPENWVLIDEGTGDRYNLCQGNYFPLPIYTEGGAYRYKLVDGKPAECTAEEIAAQEEALMPVPTATDADRLEAQVMYTALMTDTLLIEEE